MASRKEAAVADTETDEARRNREHRDKMRRHKAARDRMMETKTEERGLVVVLTGNGKGKSTSAMGMALRCVGHGMKVGIVQFIKGGMESAERRVLAGFPDLVVFRVMGEGFTWETQDRARDMAAARAAFEAAKEMVSDPSFKMVILDELNVVLRYDYLPLGEVLDMLAGKPRDTHVVITGRHAPAELVECADLVTDMAPVKHPFRSGVKAQPGVEY
ncbi:MAG: cob(I)yrinic acid a,c-diamide adenosyltransferase [Alphaproteobacteria bacterium]